MTSYQDHANTSIIMRNPTSTANFNSSITWTDHTPNTWGYQSMLGITGNCGASHGLSLWGFNGRRISLCSNDNTTDSTPWDSPSLTVWMNKVGIGTTSPSAKLEIEASNTVFTGSLISIHTNRSEWITMGYGGISTGTTHSLRFGVNNSEKMRIDNAGNVGIGTTSPGAKLTISHTRPTSITDSTDFYLGIGYGEHNHHSYRLIGFGYLSATTSCYPAYIGWKTTNNAGSTQGDLVFGTRNSTGATTVPTERMRIKDNGHVGIGTTSPSTTLHTQGNFYLSGYQSIGTTSITYPLWVSSRSSAPAQGGSKGAGKYFTASGGLYSLQHWGVEYSNGYPSGISGSDAGRTSIRADGIIWSDIAVAVSSDSKIKKI